MAASTLLKPLWYGLQTKTLPHAASKFAMKIFMCLFCQAEDKVGRKAQLLCAECLGLLGAVDPARLDVKADPPASLHSLTLPLLTELISKHLVRLLRVASSLPVLEATTFAIQVCILARPIILVRREGKKVRQGKGIQLLVRLEEDTLMMYARVYARNESSS